MKMSADSALVPAVPGSHGTTASVSRRSTLVGAHLLVTLMVGVVLGLVMLLVWYPAGYFTLMGGGRLLAIVLGCDLVLGPLVFLVIYDPGKSRLAGRVDAAALAAVRIAALAFGFSVVADSRPAFTVFAIDRFNVVAAFEVERADLVGHDGGAAHEVSWRGPERVELRLPKDPKQQNQALELELRGINLHTLPRYFAPFVPQHALAKAEALLALAERHPAIAASARQIAESAGLPDGEVVWLPVETRFGFATALLRRDDASLIAFINADPY